MARDPARLRERAASEPATVEPGAVARALEANPGEAAAVGDVLRSLDGSERGAAAVAATADRLAHDDDAVRAGAASALGVYLDDSRTADPAVVRSLAARFDDEYGVARREAGIALRALARDSPEAALEAVDSLPELLDPSDPQLTAIGLDLVETVVEADTGAAVDLLGPLLETVRATPDLTGGAVPTHGEGMGSGAVAHDQYESFARKNQRLRNRTASAIGEVLREEPLAVDTHRDVLVAVLESVDSGAVRVFLVEALGEVAETRPELVVPFVGTLGDLLDDEDSGVVAAAAWTLGILGESHGQRVADVVATRVDSLERLLSDGEEARVVSIGVLSYVCEHRPESTDRVAETLVEQLDADSSRVRAMTALALGHGGIEAAAAALDDLAETDPDEEVRAAAADALDHIRD